MDKFMEKYKEQMDQVTLSEEADKAILGNLLKADARQNIPHIGRVKRNVSAAAVAAIIVIATSATAFATVIYTGAVYRSNHAGTDANGNGEVSVNIGEAYYYDLLSDGDGEIYALIDDGGGTELAEYPVIVWKSTDQGDTWSEALARPEELGEECYILAGDLRYGEAGIETVVAIEEEDEKEESGLSDHLYLIAADSCEELDAGEVFAQLGSGPSKICFVNDHTVALMGLEQCLLYDCDAQKIVKSLPVTDSLGCLAVSGQFLLYGKDISYCMDADTLQEEEAQAGLREFVRTMFEKNNGEVFPPMDHWRDTVVCVTRSGVYEYRDGETSQVMPITGEVSGYAQGYAFNGLLPMCKAEDGVYYVCTFSDSGMSLWRIEG